MKYFAIYLLIVNAIGFLLMLIDKRKAIRHRWRIPEKTLFLTAAIGGSVGSIMGMYTFRHKTKHLQFTLGMPAILIVQLILAFIFFTRIYPL
jgi:uncharacterized membrane protein YsdA (DUF1294 family)